MYSLNFTAHTSMATSNDSNKSIQNSTTSKKTLFIVGGSILVLIFLVVTILAGILAYKSYSGKNAELTTPEDTNAEVTQMDQDRMKQLENSGGRLEEIANDLKDGMLDTSKLSNVSRKTIEDLSILTDKTLYGDAQIGFEIIQSDEGIFVYDPATETLVNYRLKDLSQ